LASRLVLQGISSSVYLIDLNANEIRRSMSQILSAELDLAVQSEGVTAGELIPEMDRYVLGQPIRSTGRTGLRL
jgi:hypothetical protein